jgi:hypothetical protein
MKVIPPLKITDAMLTSTPVIETAPAAYAGGTTYALDDLACVAGSAGLLSCYKSLQNPNTGNEPASSPTWWLYIGYTYGVYSGVTTYALGDRVIDAVNHIVLESQAAGNTGNALTDASKWLSVGPTNRWAMFNVLSSHATSFPGDFSTELTPAARSNSLYMKCSASSVTVTMMVDGVEVYSAIKDMSTRDVTGWYDYFYKAFGWLPSLIYFDLPPYSNAVITIALGAIDGVAECTYCVLGNYVDIGNIKFQSTSDVTNYSTVTRDFAGEVNTMVQRRNVPKTVQDIVADKARTNAIRALRELLNATPAVWAGIDDSDDDYFEAILILGFYTRFTISLESRANTITSLELEEI